MSQQTSEQKPSFRLIFPVYHRSDNTSSLSVSAVLVIDFTLPLALNELIICIGDITIHPRIKARNMTRKSTHHRCRISFSVGLNDTKNLSIHNKVLVCSSTGEGLQTLGQLTYNSLIPRYIAAHGPYLKNEKQDTVAFFRQAVGGSLVFTVRHANVTDARRAQPRLFFAFVVAQLLPVKRPIILYEKNASKYEESGKAVYENLIDRGYRHAYFVIAKEAAKSLDIEERYRRNFLFKHSFRHYVYFFRSRTFIGTEAVPHSLELRCQNPFAQRHMKNRKSTFVFLQHGVMLMVSLDSPERTSFIRKAMKGRVRVVVSSEKEAEHFIDLAGYSREELIVSGLPKFDFSYLNKNADKILIMPTWRIWEFNAMRTDPDSTAYVAMIKRIEAAIPEKLRNKVVSEYHPLFARKTFGNSTDDKSQSLDVLLRDVKLLITDYSSIAFDAFYRGANVIFYWEDLEDCMRHYGEPTHLMLDRESAFGEVCMNEDELKQVIEDAYCNPQREEHVARFRQLVSHNDSQNTERLVSLLKEEGIVQTDR